MRRGLPPFVVIILAIFIAGCQFSIFISDTRMRGPVPPQEVLASTAAAETAVAANATATPSAGEARRIDDIIANLETLVGGDLVAQFSYSGRESPRAARPMRDMRVEPGDTIRVSAGRSQEIAVEAEEYCVGSNQDRCSRVWVHGRPGGGSQGAWYPIVVFEYDLE